MIKDYNNFGDDSNEEYEDCECGGCEYNGYEWTEEDSWDALTDGMYGERPSSPWMYDAMCDDMGF